MTSFVVVIAMSPSAWDPDGELLLVSLLRRRVSLLSTAIIRSCCSGRTNETNGRTVTSCIPGARIGGCRSVIGCHACTTRTPTTLSSVYEYVAAEYDPMSGVICYESATGDYDDCGVSAT